MESSGTILIQPVLKSFSRYSELLGTGLQVFLSVSAGSLMTSSGVLLCFIASTLTCCTVKIKPTLYVSRQSYYPFLIPPASLHLHILQEILLSIIHLGLYCVASYMLMTAVTSHLYRLTEVILFQFTYKALTAVYCMGFAAAAVHLCDLVASILAFGLWQK